MKTTATASAIVKLRDHDHPDFLKSSITPFGALDFRPIDALPCRRNAGSTNTEQASFRMISTKFIKAASIFIFSTGSLLPASAAEIFGSFLCEVIEAKSSGFEIGDQIAVGITPDRLMWFSALGGGLQYDCDNSGHILICQLDDGGQRVVVDTKQLLVMRSHAVADGSWSEFETWKCAKMSLRDSGQ